MSDKPKKKFNETGFGKFLNKAGQVLPTVLEAGMEIASGDIGGAISVVHDKLTEKARTSDAAANLLRELELKRMEWERELVALEVEDRKSAREREATLANNGMRDWFQYIVGGVGLSVFGFVVYVLTYITVPDSNRDLFIHLVGIVEGVILSIFGYYYGTSLGSRLKDNKPK